MEIKDEECFVSPCVRVCQLGKDGLCEGCGRTMEEIQTWPSITLEERKKILIRLNEFDKKKWS